MDYLKQLIRSVDKEPMGDGYCTAWELLKQYGISRAKVSRAVRAGKITGVMKGAIDKYGNEIMIMKWYIVKNQALTDFIAKERKQ